METKPKKVAAKVAEEEEEVTTELYYQIKPKKGDVYITINAGRGCEVKVMSGQTSTPPTKPPHGGG